MKPEQKRALIFFAACIVVILLIQFLLNKQNAPVTEAAQTPDNDEFTSPFMWPTPGIYPDTPGFQSTVNVFADNPLLGTLAYQYIPVFGLVGMTGVSDS